LRGWLAGKDPSGNVPYGFGRALNGAGCGGARGPRAGGVEKAGRVEKAGGVEKEAAVGEVFPGPNFGE
jgi:hypothetical protein